MKIIFKLTLGLDTTMEDPDFEWIEYFSTKGRMDKYIKQYEKIGKVEFGKKYKDYSWEEIKLDNPEELVCEK